MPEMTEHVASDAMFRRDTIALIPDIDAADLDPLSAVPRLNGMPVSLSPIAVPAF